MNRQTGLEHAALVVILILGAGLRFYELGAASMWWDEILVPLICRFPATSILEWLRVVEVHPPLYYMLTKFVMIFDTSDTSLRLLSAVPGVLSVYVIHRIGKDLFGLVAGLAAAALLAANPYAIWLSRIVRPYSLFLFVFLLALWALSSWMRTGSRKALWGIIAANLVLFWTHYMMVVLIPAFGLVVLGSCWPRLKDFWIFFGASTLSFFSILPFFLQNFFRPHWLGPGSPWDILAGVAANTLKLGWFFKGPVAWAVLVLACVGLVRAARCCRGAVWTALLLACVPVAVVVVGKLAWTHEPRYFLFLMPLLLLAAGLGVQTLALLIRNRAGKWASLAIAVVLSGLVLMHSDSFYGERSLLGLSWVSYKTAARMVPALVKTGEPVMISEEGFHNALDWYLQRNSGPNPLRTARITPEDPDVILNFLWFERMGHLAATPQELKAKFTDLVDVGVVDKVSFFKTVIPRTPVQKAQTLPWEQTFEGPRQVLGASHSMQGLVLTPYWGGELQCAQNDVAGFVEYAVETPEPGVPQRIQVAGRYVNEGDGNILRVLTRFDQEPWTEAVAFNGPDRYFYQRVLIDRTAPFTRLTVRVEMTCAMQTPQYPGGNLGSLRLKSLLVALSPLP